jgi:hypothetical protein
MNFQPVVVVDIVVVVIEHSIDGRKNKGRAYVSRAL